MTAETLEIRTTFMTDDAENPVARVRRGDVAAFRSIFEQHHHLILQFLYGMVGDKNLAEELTQETFIRAYQNINTLKDETKLATWLCAIAKNMGYNTFRARRSAPQIIEIDEQNPVFACNADVSPDAQLLNNELNQVIHDALKKLDDDKRTVFTLKMIQQLSYEEIAEITGFSIPKLKSDLHRAKAEMRKLIQPYIGDPQ